MTKMLLSSTLLLLALSGRALGQTSSADNTATNTNATVAPSGSLFHGSWSRTGMRAHACSIIDGVESVTWSFYEDNNRQCLFNNEGSIMTPVQTFVELYVADSKARFLYSSPSGTWPTLDASVFECTPSSSSSAGSLSNTTSYTRLGCDHTSSKKLALNTYGDATCSPSSLLSSIKLGSKASSTSITSSELVSFGNCRTCMNLHDASATSELSVCNYLWSSGTFCDEDCKTAGHVRQHWSSTTIIAVVLEVFVLGVLAMCISRDVALLQERTNSAALIGVGSRGAMRTTSTSRTLVGGTPGEPQKWLELTTPLSKGSASSLEMGGMETGNQRLMEQQMSASSDVTGNHGMRIVAKTNMKMATLGVVGGILLMIAGLAAAKLVMATISVLFFVDMIGFVMMMKIKLFS